MSSYYDSKKNDMKKLILPFLLVLITFCSCDKKPKFTEADLVGRWQCGTLWERYVSGGSGYTWDTSDDVDESEAQTFTWKLEEDKLTQYHQMEMGGVVPKQYTITELSGTTLKYEANGKTYTFTRR